MKQWIATLIMINVLNEFCCQCDSRKLSDKFSFMTIKYEMLTAFDHYYSKAGNAIMNMARIVGRQTNYKWLRFRSWLFDHEFVLGRGSAEFFFHEEQEARDRVIALMQEELDQLTAKNDKALKKQFCMSWNMIEWIRKIIRSFQWFFRWRKIGNTKNEIEKAKKSQIETEYFCEKPDFESLTKYCELAMKNEKLLARLRIVSNISEMEQPECQLRSVSLPQYNFETKRKFLRCPIIATGRNASSLDASLQYRQAFSKPKHKTQEHDIPETIQTPNSPPNSTQSLVQKPPFAPGTPPQEEPMFLGDKSTHSRSPSPDRSQEEPMFLGAKNTHSRSPSPDRQPDNSKKGIFSLFSVKNSNNNNKGDDSKYKGDDSKYKGDNSPLEIVTLVINKDIRIMEMRKARANSV